MPLLHNKFTEKLCLPKWWIIQNASSAKWPVGRYPCPGFLSLASPFAETKNKERNSEAPEQWFMYILLCVGAQVQAVLRRHWNQYKIQFEHSFSHSDAMRTASYTVSTISDVQGYGYGHDCASEHLNGKGYHDMDSVALKTEKLYGWGAAPSPVPCANPQLIQWLHGQKISATLGYVLLLNQHVSHVYVCVCVYTRAYILLFVFVYLYSMDICAYISIYVCAFIQGYKLCLFSFYCVDKVGKFLYKGNQWRISYFLGSLYKTVLCWSHFFCL